MTDTMPEVTRVIHYAEERRKRGLDTVYPRDAVHEVQGRDDAASRGRAGSLMRGREAKDRRVAQRKEDRFESRADG